MIGWADAVAEAGHGETLVMDERLVLSPCAGRFRPQDEVDYSDDGEFVLKGQVVGNVISSSGEVVPVHTPFTGWMMGFMLPSGSPVESAEPVVWLRSH
jgi:hypothetical protein